MLGSKIEPPKPTKIKKLGLTGSASSEFAKRFMTKPTRQPKVIDFSAGNLHGDKKRRGINGFFPPMKLRSSSRDLSARSNTSTDTKVNAELPCQNLYIDVTRQGCDSEDPEDHETQISTQQPSLPDIHERRDQLTQENIQKQFPKLINIPIVDRVTETDETGSTRAIDTTLQFKLPSVVIGGNTDHVDKKTNGRTRCAACNAPDRTEEIRNGLIIDGDMNATEVHYEDFTNAILGHLASLNFRYRREWTIHLDTTSSTNRPYDLPSINRMHSDITVANKNVDKTDFDKYNVEVMKYMTREIYTNLKLTKFAVSMSASLVMTPSKSRSNDNRTPEHDSWYPGARFINGLTTKEVSRGKEDRLQLVPTSFSEVRPRSNTSRTLSRASRRSVAVRKTPESVRTAPPLPSETNLSYSDTFDCDDLSYLPPPKRILPRRDVPWVFRYKVKRNMNELSKILASKPNLAIENI